MGSILQTQLPQSAISDMGGLVNLDMENAKVMEGKVFTVSKRFDVPAEGIWDIIVDPTFYTGLNDSKTMIMLPLIFTGIGSRVNIDVGTNPTYADDGVSLPPFNRNFKSSNTSNVVVINNPTVSDAGTLGPELLLTANGASANAATGAQVGLPLILNVNLDRTYLLRLDNQTNSIAYMSMILAWLEF